MGETNNYVCGSCGYTETIRLGRSMSQPASEHLTAYSCNQCQAVMSIAKKDQLVCGSCGSTTLSVLMEHGLNFCPKCRAKDFKNDGYGILWD